MQHNTGEHISTHTSSHFNYFTCAKFHARKAVTPKVTPAGRFQAALEKQVCEGLVLALGFLTFSDNVDTLTLKRFNGPKVMPEYNHTTPSPKKGVKTPQKGTFTLLCDEGDSTSSGSSFGSRSSDGSEYSVSSDLRYEWMYTPPPDPRIQPMRRFRCRKRLRFSPSFPPTSPLFTPGGQRKRFRRLRYIDEVVEKRDVHNEL